LRLEAAAAQPLERRWGGAGTESGEKPAQKRKVQILLKINRQQRRTRKCGGHGRKNHQERGGVYHYSGTITLGPKKKSVSQAGSVKAQLTKKGWADGSLFKEPTGFSGGKRVHNT